jgi:hypothetical protein
MGRPYVKRITYSKFYLYSYIGFYQICTYLFLVVKLWDIPSSTSSGAIYD